MRFLDNLSKTISSGVDRAKYEADKFQRASKISGEIANLKAQTDTNMRQLGERALELYQQGTLQAPEIASLAQIIAQLREQQTARQVELDQVNAETFEQYQATQPATPSDVPASNQIPISREPSDSSYDAGNSYGASSSTYDTSASTESPSAGVGVGAVGSTPYACSNCGFALPDGAMFCPNCGARVIPA
jgi:hypothetical protein